MKWRASKTAVCRVAVVAGLMGLIAAPAALAAAPKLAPTSESFRAYQQKAKRGVKTQQRTAEGRALGLRPTPIDPPPVVSEVGPVRLGGTLPAKYNLASYGRLTPVRDQGAQSEPNNYWLNTCWAFAAYGSLESYVLTAKKASVNYAEDNMALTAGFDFSTHPYEEGGHYLMSTAYLTRWGGPGYEATDPYGDEVTPNPFAVVRHAQEALFLPGGTPTKASSSKALKQAIVSRGAVGTAMYWSDGAYNSKYASYRYSGAAAYSNHAVALVGWNDYYPRTRFKSRPAGNGAWLVRNSWGRFNRTGYFWVSYYDKFVARPWTLNVQYRSADLVSNYTDIHQHDPLGLVTSTGYSGTTTAYGANVFTATNAQQILAAGFYTLSPYSTYRVWVVPVVDGKPGPLSAERLVALGTFATPGYHTAKFTAAASVAAGAQFAVVVKLSEPYGDESPLAVELAEPGYSSGASAAAGQSWVSQSGSAWTDLTTMDSTANLCIKAYGVR